MANGGNAGLLGRLAVHKKLITMEQLLAATSEQGRFGNENKRLGEILIAMGFLSSAQLDELLTLQRSFLSELSSHDDGGATTPNSSPAANPAPSSSGLFAAPTGAAPSPAAAPRPSPPPSPTTDPRAISLEPSTPTPPTPAPPAAAPFATPTTPPAAFGTPTTPPAAFATPATPPLAAAPPSPATSLPTATSPAFGSPAPATPPATPPPTQAPPQAPPPAQAAPAGPAAESSRPTLLELSAPAGETQQLDGALTGAARMGASDMHFHPGLPMKVRTHGRLHDFGNDPLATAFIESVLLPALNPAQRRLLDEEGQVDFAHTIEGTGRFRGNVYRGSTGLNGVFRFIPGFIPSLSQLGLPSDLSRVTTFHQGLVLVTGPAGCGKSTTLASLVNIINEERNDHVLTIEDPVEYLHTSKRCLVNQREVKRHTGSFARALRAALREDPDVIVIGELRDLETISLAITAAETGHLVLGTLHTGSAIRTINRLVGAFPPEEQPQIRTMISESLRAVISQRLVARADGQGRVPALEILTANRAVSNVIREGRTFQLRSALQTGRSQGQLLLDVALGELVKAGTVTKEEALRQAEDPRLIG